MKSLLRSARVAALPFVFGAAALLAGGAEAKPVTPNASPEAVALLQLLYDVSGRYTLTGQHNFPNTKSRNSQFAAKYIGKSPVIFGSDWGHAKAGDSDSYLARPDIVQEAIRQHRLGAIVALCWHAVPPTADEPITFRQLPGSDPKKLTSVQGKLLDAQFKDVLTPGTALYEHWCAQVDAIAGYLRQLQDAHVPVLWRPYHEMNGDWFWWGGRPGEGGTVALYKQLFDRLVNHHHLTNLVWVWSMDRPNKPEMAHAKYFPGSDFVDVLSLDVYGSDFAPAYYDSLVTLSNGKPIALAEVGSPPKPEILEQQPKWAYYMTWASMVRNTPVAEYDALMHDPRVLSLEDPAYWAVTASYRAACGLPPLHFEPAAADFSGIWDLNEGKSDLGKFGAASAPSRLEIAQHGPELSIKTTRVSEFADDQVTEEKLSLDGTESKSEFMNAPRVTTAHTAASGAKIVVESVVTFPWGAPGSKMSSTETWTLLEGGRTLSIQRHAVSPRGEQNMTLVFSKI